MGVVSGGHWNYLGRRLEENAKSGGEMFRLLGALEHELDWGLCGDTCYACAANRMAPALCAFFDGGCDDATLAIAVARDHRQHMCADCAERKAKR